MEAMGLVLLLAALLAGMALGAVLMRQLGNSARSAGDARAEAERATERADMQTTISNARSDAARAQAELSRAQADQAAAREQMAQAKAEVARAQATTAEIGAQLAGARAERDAAIERAAELTADRESLVAQFKALSAETLADQGKKADVAAEQRLAATRELMQPVAASLIQLNNRITQVEKERSQLAASLREQVNTVVATSESLRRETSALSTALRKPQVRGAWGELQLKRVVQISGMLDHCDFYEQASDQTTADARIRPDLKVMLGDDKFVYVDSKVPLAAYLDAMEAGSDAEREAKLSQFGDNVKGHVDKLSAKQYWKADTSSPEFVVLFIPSEALAAEALAQRPDLHEYAAGKGIILASPTTLIGLLRAVAYGWKQAALADSAAEVFAIGRELHDRLSTMGNHFNKLGRALQSSVAAYNSTLGSLEGRVLVSARRLRDLKVSDAELAALKGVDDSPKLMSAPELLADAAAAELAAGPPNPALEEFEQIAPKEQSATALLIPQESDGSPSKLRELG